ncbi:hypothetical protein AJ79_03604 [Helicocarpus griseus UAMH5409]|uniref:C2H2-type domain-containing protein n=1 Tax=Helicocarpus griseus UAMH5409 TaxID=1447875 RepID=A0A2B7XNX8_9EURO|nr:hypothetical protein AJ79_03604 [Helicocarpus griseus UAMH5409]
MSDVPNDPVQLQEEARLSPTSPSELSLDTILAFQSALLHSRPIGEPNGHRTLSINSSPLPSIPRSKQLIQSKESARGQQLRSQPLVVHAALQGEVAPAIANKLQEIWRELKLLQESGSLSNTEDPQTINVFQRKLELLTQAVLSVASPRTTPSTYKSTPSSAAERSKASSSSVGSSSEDMHQDAELWCWDSCCNGRKFSNKSNMVRHRRERSGHLAKFRCSFCNAYFSRRSVRNAHEANRICRLAER